MLTTIYDYLHELLTHVQIQFQITVCLEEHVEFNTRACIYKMRNVCTQAGSRAVWRSRCKNNICTQQAHTYKSQYGTEMRELSYRIIVNNDNDDDAYARRRVGGASNYLFSKR